MFIHKGPTGRAIPILTTAAICICVAVFLAVNVERPTTASLARWGFLPERDLYGGAYWGLVTSAFVHIEPIHLLFNMYWLWILGGALERTLGPLRWLIFVVSAAFVSGGLQMASGHTGIGMSGVGYALFGFGWLSRTRFPEFARIVNQRVVQVFVLWGVLCFVLTYLQLMNIGNFAHLGGFLFGAAVGGAMSQERDKSTYVATALLASAASIVPLFYNPLSVEWVSLKAYNLHNRHDYAQALAMYQKVVRMNGNKAWAWHNMAEIYGFERDATDYEETLDSLRQVDPRAAVEVAQRYGDPHVEGPPDSKPNRK